MRIIESRNNQNSNSSNQNLSLWRRGKNDYRAFTEYNVKKWTFIKTTLLGMFITLLCILPVLFLIVQLFKVFVYNPSIKIFLLVCSWALLLVCNGLSNYFTVILTKNSITDDEKLQKFNERAICFYQTFNFGFIIFTFLILIVLVFGVI